MRKVKLGDLVTVMNEREDNPSRSKYDRFVGLEHYDSGSVSIVRWGPTEMLVSAMKVFHRGDILVARRNVYLKRASSVDFDGITSGDSIILHVNDEQYKAIVPFVLNTDSFWDYADQHSDGSMSKRLAPKTMLEYEFTLPDDGKVERLSTLLWAMERTKTAYRNLIAKTDELVKSQFVEMFENGDYPLIEAGTVMFNMRNGLSPSTKGTYHEKVLTLTAITQGWFDPEQWKDGTFDICPPNEKRISSSEFYICRGNGNRTLVGAGVISTEDRADLIFPDTVIAAQVDERRICLPYLYHAWKQPSVRDQIESAARTTNGTYKINQGIISKVRLVLPPIGAQKVFVTITEQSDKSKFAAQQALADLTATQKALMRQYLG